MIELKIPKINNKLHLTDKELINYKNGLGSEEKKERIREHLNVCLICEKNFQMMMDILENYQSIPIDDKYRAMAEKLIKEDEEEAKETPTPIFFRATKYAKGVEQEIQTEQWLPMAAGVRQDFPEFQKLDSKLFDGEDVSLTFRQSGNTLTIGMVGASIPARSKTMLTLTFDDDTKETLLGEKIQLAGCWKVKTKGKKIKSAEVRVKENK